MKSHRRTLLFLTLALAGTGLSAAPHILFEESFERPPTVAWKHEWGPAANSAARARTGGHSLQCTVENKYGMSVHSWDLPARPGATYTLTAFVFIPQQEKECFPQLQICNTQWDFLAQASPTKKGGWEELRCVWTNTENLKTIRIALHNNPWQEGLGGAMYFWDDVTLSEEGGDTAAPAGSEEHPAMPEGMDARSAGSGGKIVPSAAPAPGTVRTLLHESFEGSPIAAWKHEWGAFAHSLEQAHEGNRSLQCTVEDKYGMSVHYWDLPAKPGATYTLTAFVFIPQQEKECFPQLQICNTQWGPLAQASPTTKGGWEQLRCEWTNTENLKSIRIALHNNPWQEGLGGAVYFWDDITLTEAGGVTPPATNSEARGQNPAVLAGLEVKPAGGMKITVAAGKALVLGREVAVAETTLEIAPPPILQVTDEATTLSDDAPEGFSKGTALVHCVGFGATLPCLEPGSIVIKEKPGSDGLVYEQGKDWRADETWGRVGRLPAGRIAAGQTVYIDYRTRPLRVDTICINPSGRVSVNPGDSQKVCPSIPAADYGSLALCRIFLDYGCREITAREIYPVGEPFPPPDVVALNEHRARVAKTREKLEQGKDVTIVAWGDSVTAGGDASRPELRFCEAFAQALRYKYPQARIQLVNAGRGGWNSARSLPLFEDDVLKHKPDLVTMEFVNDMGLGEPTLRKNWFEAIDRVRAIGGEAVIVTPHFVLPMWMKFPGIGAVETRPNVEALRKIAAEKQVALADASKRWEHLALEGVPYLVHLRNGINHPDDFGHGLFVEELMRLF